MRTYSGVSYNRFTKQYTSTVTRNKVKYNCGSYDTEIEAAKARDRKILEKGLNVKLQVLKPAKSIKDEPGTRT